MTEVVAKKAPLEDVMAAMDVVDTLRHQRDIATRELDAEGRRARFMQRLRELYAAQGIEVSDQVLREGIDALEQERFKYQPVKASFSTKIAKIWVSRARWGRPLGWLLLLAILFYAIYFAVEVLPQRQMRSALPQQLQFEFDVIGDLVASEQLLQRAKVKFAAGQRAVDENDFSRAGQILHELTQLKQQLQQEYTIRVVSRPGESSGVWRVPDVNPQGRKYYLIVEAIDSANKVVVLDVVSEESNASKRVSTWGIRVDEQTFYQVADDKSDDGIIQGNEVGRKQAGYLEPEYSISTSGAKITEW
ncbi:MAG: hypothetical protein KJP04_09400 [Arenicella sp.]|nr:hypothetical protein [Arenicella sp.]